MVWEGGIEGDVLKEVLVVDDCVPWLLDLVRSLVDVMWSVIKDEYKCYEDEDNSCSAKVL
jgi:hypothetical protein